MNRAVLILAAVGVNLVFLLSGRMSKGLMRRHGRLLRFMALFAVDTCLGAGLILPDIVDFRFLTYGFLSASLSLLMQPVPPNKPMRLRILPALCLPVPLLALRWPWACPLALCTLLLLSRVILSRRRLRMLDTLTRSASYRKMMQETDRSNWEILLLSLVVAAHLSAGIPIAMQGCCAVSALLYLWLDIRWCSATCFFCMHSLEESVVRAMTAGRPRSAQSDPVLADRLLYERCCRYMTERRPFLVESFSLLDLAGVMYTNKVYVSKTINEYAHKNFRQWVNHYRVQYSMDLFRRNMSLKTTELASLSGFRSQTTYAMAFKLVMEESPSEWCKRVRFNALKG